MPVTSHNDLFPAKIFTIQAALWVLCSGLDTTEATLVNLLSVVSEGFLITLERQLKGGSSVPTQPNPPAWLGFLFSKPLSPPPCILPCCSGTHSS